MLHHRRRRKPVFDCSTPALSNMASLWSQSSPEAWQAALDGYSDAVEGLGKERLPDLDRFVVVLVTMRWGDRSGPNPLARLRALPAIPSGSLPASGARARLWV